MRRAMIGEAGIEIRESGMGFAGYVGYLKRSKQGQNEPGARHSVQEDPVPYDDEPPETPTPK
jgi:hypothetical protein